MTKWNSLARTLDGSAPGPDRVDVSLTIEEWRRVVYTTDPKHCGVSTFEGVYDLVRDALARAEAETKLTLSIPAGMVLMVAPPRPK